MLTRFVVAASIGYLRWRALARIGTIARPMGELGAKTPWHRMRLARGRDTVLAE